MEYSISEENLQVAIKTFEENNRGEKCSDFAKLMRSDSNQSNFYTCIMETDCIMQDVREKGFSSG